MKKPQKRTTKAQFVLKQLRAVARDDLQFLQLVCDDPKLLEDALWVHDTLQSLLNTRLQILTIRHVAE